jgi:hypothetical protein
MARTAVIMQPTYLPWCGYFDLMDQADIFVLLDSVQFDRRSWQQRNRVKGPQGEQWLTVPVRSKGRVEQRIADVEIDTSSGFARRHVESLRHLYAKAPFYAAHAESLARILENGHARLAELSGDVIKWLRDALAITTPIVRSSVLEVTGKRVELLVDVCGAVGADCYLSPAGSRGYIEADDLFAQRGIALRYHAYSPVPYRQLHGAFLPYLSLVDVLFNEGERSLEIVRAGRRTEDA